jgi:hypothetical protein
MGIVVSFLRQRGRGGRTIIDIARAIASGWRYHPRLLGDGA